MRYAGDEPEVRPGLVSPELAAEHPGLWLAWTELEAAPGPTPPELRERLRAMADRIRGADAIAMRGREIPHAHRVFFRHVGLDPDVVRTPVEAIMLRRMQQGGLRPQGLDPRRPHGRHAGDRSRGVGVRRRRAGRRAGAGP